MLFLHSRNKLGSFTLFLKNARFRSKYRLEKLREAVGAEVDARRQVDEEPRRELAVLGELAHVRRLQPRGDVPVDVAHVVAGLVLAQDGEVQAVAVEQAPVVALEQAIQPADDLPVEALEDALRR